MIYHDLIVVGGGPAGLALASAAYDTGVTDTLILEKEASLGGRLRPDSAEPYGKCGIKVFKKEMTAEEYLRRFLRLLEIYEVPFQVSASVSEIRMQDKAGHFLLECRTADGSTEMMECRALALATGSNADVRFPSVKVSAEDGKPEINKYFGTSIQGLYAVGDFLRMHSLPDEASEEGAMAGRSIAEYLKHRS